MQTARALFLRMYGLEESTLYQKFPRIKRKKNGTNKVRWIHAPNPKLKLIQQEILSRVLYRFAHHPCAHGYVARRNIVSGALQHCNLKHTIVLDLENFFPSIKKDRIRKCLEFYQSNLRSVVTTEADRVVFAWDGVSVNTCNNIETLGETFNDITSLDLLLEAITLNDSIPQGAPTSGAISNIIMYPLDCLFEQTATSHDLIYTRYADDLAFSGNDLEKLKQTVFGYIFHKIAEAGLVVNQAKVHVLRQNHKMITGLNVCDNGVRPSRKYRRKIRSQLCNLRNAVTKTTTLDDAFRILGPTNAMAKMFGHLWYLGYADTYSEAYNQWVADYFKTIQQHITKFLPKFGCNVEIKILTKPNDIFASSTVEPIWTIPMSAAAAKKAAAAQTIVSPTQWLIADEDIQQQVIALHHQFVKLDINETVIANYSSVGSIQPLLKDPKISYKVKRYLIKQRMKTATIFDHSTDALRRLFRYAGPADLFTIVKNTISRITSLSEQALEVISRPILSLPIHHRIELLRDFNTIHRDYQFELMAPMKRIAAIEILRKLMRGLTTIQLADYLTSDNGLIRQVAGSVVIKRVDPALQTT